MTKEELEENGPLVPVIPSTSVRDEYTTFAIEKSVFSKWLMDCRVFEGVESSILKPAMPTWYNFSMFPTMPEIVLL